MNLLEQLKALGTKKLVTYGSILVIMIMLLIFSFPSNTNNTGTISVLIKQIRDTIQTTYTTLIKDKEKEIKVLQDKINAASEKEKDLQNKIDKLEKEIYGKKKPTSSKELRDRFIALGYTPIDGLLGR